MLKCPDVRSGKPGQINFADISNADAKLLLTLNHPARGTFFDFFEVARE
jgi:hypothetical protein